MIVAALALLVAVFWAGRASAPRLREESNGVNRLPARFSDRSGSLPPVRTGGPGAGGQAISSAMQLRDVFKNSGGNMQLGSALADAALSRMNAAEISRLVEDLAQAQASTPGYNFTLEIQAACARWAEVDPRAALRFVLSSRQASFRNAALGSLFAGMAKLDPAMARAELAVIEDPSLRRSAQASLLSALAVADPDEWVATLLADPSLHEQYGMASIVSEWAMDDPAKAAERLGKLPAKLQASGVVSLAKVWASKDAGAAQAWALSLGDSKQRQLALGAVAGGIAARDPDAALESLDALDASSRRAGIKAVFSTLLDLDFDLALEKASGITDPAEKKAALAVLCGSDYYSGDDPFASMSTYGGRSSEQLVKLLGELPAGQARSAALERLGSHLGAATPDEAERILATYSGKERDLLESRMLRRMAETEPGRALDLYQSLPPGQQTPSTLGSIINNLASTDPEKALELALNSDSEQLRSTGAAQAFRHLAESNPEAASQRLDSLPAGSPERQAALYSLASVWGRQDPDAAAAWADELDPQARAVAYDSLIPALAESDPLKASGLLADLVQSGTNDPTGRLSNMTSNLVDRWANSDMDAAAGWTAALEESTIKSSAVSQLVSTWHAQDPDGAAQWINNLPEAASRDSAVRYVVQATSRHDPAGAFEWASTLSDDQQRFNQMENVATRWLASDQEQARAAIRQSDLPAEVRQRLLEPAE